ncbi:hypothetical protein B0H11DRAFT_2239147 [Mycena galericulata]|nr:hypothetical protein B0H11DRAFT_2239147 [Mycena galericulata]
MAKNAAKLTTSVVPLTSSKKDKSSIPSGSAPELPTPSNKNASRSTTHKAPLVPSKNAPNWDLKPTWGPPIVTMVPRGGQRPEFDFNDRVLATDLYEKITKKKKLQWTLHSKLNVPLCLDKHSCSICRKYVKHVEKARGSGGRLTAANDDNMEVDDDEDDEDDEDFLEGAGEDLDIGESRMDYLFKLQDLIGKSRSVSWSDTAVRNITEASGIVAALQAQAIAEQKCEAAKTEQVALSTRLASLQVNAEDKEAKFEELMKNYGGVEAERDFARQQLRETNSQLTGALAELQQAKEQLSATQILLASAEAEVKQLGDEGNTDLRPRKHPKTAPDVLLLSPEPLSLEPLSLEPPEPLSPEPLSPEDKVWMALNQMRRPAVTDSPEDIAHFLQFNEEMGFKGIPLRGEQWMVDMRDIRGYREVMGRAPRKTRFPSNNYQYLAHCVTQILRILTIPGEYGRLLKEQGVAVTAAEDLSPCNFGDRPAALSNGQVARLLADKGLSLAAADDAWQFCCNYAQAQVASPDPFFDPDVMRQLLGDVGARSAPRLKPIAVDMYPRSIPGKHRIKDNDRRIMTDNNRRKSTDKNRRKSTDSNRRKSTARRS